MTIAYSCVMIVLLLPYVWMYFAKKSLIFSGHYNNQTPRLLLSTLQGAEQRANWAQQNSFESLPAFIGAVIIAHLAGAPQHLIDIMAIIHLVARTLYGVFYIANMATLRSLVWTIGLLTVIGLFVISY